MGHDRTSRTPYKDWQPAAGARAVRRPVRDLEAIAERLDDPACRLLTLVGPGGIGKTRLALEVAATSGQRYPDGAWLVELDVLCDPALMPLTVAAALGLRGLPDQPLLETLGAHMRPRHLILILDNCEHLLGACADLTGALLATWPHLCILATSREPLDIGGEMA